MRPRQIYRPFETLVRIAIQCTKHFVETFLTGNGSFYYSTRVRDAAVGNFYLSFGAKMKRGLLQVPFS